MNSNKELEINQLKKLIRSLNPKELGEIKREIDFEMRKKQSNKEEKLRFQSLLKKGPVFTNEQIEKVYEARARLNQWRNH